MSGSKGAGPRLFCGHVPKDVDEVAVKAHFSQWGTVTDVYFPRHKKTLKRRPFCFVTFSSPDSVRHALAESPLTICGHPIKSLTAVEDRDAYYRDKHASAAAGVLGAGASSVLDLHPMLSAALLNSTNVLEAQRLLQLMTASAAMGVGQPLGGHNVGMSSHPGFVGYGDGSDLGGPSSQLGGLGPGGLGGMLPHTYQQQMGPGTTLEALLAAQVPAGGYGSWGGGGGTYPDAPPHFPSMPLDAGYSLYNRRSEATSDPSLSNGSASTHSASPCSSNFWAGPSPLQSTSTWASPGPGPRLSLPESMSGSRSLPSSHGE